MGHYQKVDGALDRRDILELALRERKLIEPFLESEYLTKRIPKEFMEYMKIRYSVIINTIVRLEKNNVNDKSVSFIRKH